MRSEIDGYAGRVDEEGGCGGCGNELPRLQLKSEKRRRPNATLVSDEAAEKPRQDAAGETPGRRAR